MTMEISATDKNLLHSLYMRRNKVIEVENYNYLLNLAVNYQVKQGGDKAPANFENIFVFDFSLNGNSQIERSFLYVQVVFVDKMNEISFLKILNKEFDDCDPPCDEYSSPEAYWSPAIPKDCEADFICIPNKLFEDNFFQVKELSSSYISRSPSSCVEEYLANLLKDLNH